MNTNITFNSNNMHQSIEKIVTSKKKYPYDEYESRKPKAKSKGKKRDYTEERNRKRGNSLED